MARKTNEQRLQEVIDRGLTVDKIIETLSKFSGDALVGVVGHFGEDYPCPGCDKEVSDNPDGWY